MTIADFFSQLMAIVLINIVLGADNAIVIGLACRDLPPKVRMKGIVLGTVGAVVVRGAATAAIVLLLKIKYLMLVGGLILTYIGVKLIIKDDDVGDIKASNSLIRAIFTVIAADMVMGIDNMLGVAGIASGNIVMVFIGLALSIPVIVLGSTVVMRLMNRFPIIIYIGAAVILYTSGKMIVDEPAVASFFESHLLFRWVLIAFITVSGLVFGVLYNRHKNKRKENIGNKRSEEQPRNGK